MEQYIRLVKGQINWLQNQISRFTPDHPRYRPEQVALYQRLVVEHEHLLRFLEGLPLTEEPPIALPNGTVRSSPHDDDLSDLPGELLAELSDRATKGAIDPLVKIIADRGGVASLDDILIDLFRKQGLISKRTLVANKLHRLSKQGAVWSLPGRKGLYTTKQPDATP
jgi:hypothetical protein